MVTINGTKFMEIGDVAELMDLTPARVRQLASEGAFAGAVQLSLWKTWLIPASSAKKTAEIPRPIGRPRSKS